jgi:hypothetical protein
MANYFDNIQNVPEHIVAESSRLTATISGHMYDLRMIEDTDNGIIVAIDNTLTPSEAGYNEEEQVYNAKAYAAGDKPYLVLTPPLAYNGRKLWSAEKYFYNAKGDVARCYELHVDDIYTISAMAFSGTPEVGKYVDGNYAVQDAAPADGFVGQIMQRVDYTDRVAYRVRVVALGC